MRNKQISFTHLSSSRNWIGVVCLLLVGAAFVAGAFHLHPNDLSDAKHCTVCQIAHAPFQAVAHTHILLGLAATAFFSDAAQASPKTFLTSFSLFSRPPPLV
ncbi:MAG TPA: hypothetical protein VKE93_04210 [Candidatus Angelobacter sp.]|nr:hypothetical protein [Candidatus Angelobacter sp.]